MADGLDTAKVQALASYLKTRMQAREVAILSADRLSGGAIQDNYGISVECRGGPYEGSHELVIRSDAPSQVAVSMTRAQEFRVLQVAYEAGVTVPEPLWCCEDDALIGAPFSIMTRAPGTASARALVKQMGDAPEQARALVRQLGRELARVHGISPTPRNTARLSFLPMPANTPALGRVKQYRQALDALPAAHLVLEWALNWLEDNAVDSGLRSLCHGDFRSGNYMVKGGELTAVLDWEFASWGDPYEDLGWMCARSWRFGAPQREVGGIGSRSDLYGAWETETGHTVDDRKVRYWEVMGMLRWAIIARQQGQRHTSGQQHSLELALTGRMLHEIELDILATIAQIDDKPLSANLLQPCSVPSAAGETGLPVTPDTASVLETARQTYINELLPKLPKNVTYDALMVANAMGASIRELRDQGRSAAALQTALEGFLHALVAADAQNTAPVLPVNPDLRRELAHRIRERLVPVGCEPTLRQLLVQETCTLLSISNPKYLEGHRASAGAFSTVEGN